ncbi:MAG: hypothetical protein DRO46_02560 [Candidatus Hecatellales archaeon]|nr:MAG: hypothetical protein DRO46_02560 [Candidatus Hecatellales archaeon]
MRKPRVLLVVGHHNSGKTRTIELLASKLKGLGFKVASMKHVHEVNFTFDLRGKDTWRHWAAGVETTLAVSPSEIVLFRRIEGYKVGWGRLLAMLGEGYDVVLGEGFRLMAGKRRDVYKLVAARSLEEAESLLRDLRPPVVAVVGWGIAWPSNQLKGKPLLRLPEEAERLVDLVLRRVLQVKVRGSSRGR